MKAILVLSTVALACVFSADASAQDATPAGSTAPSSPAAGGARKKPKGVAPHPAPAKATPAPKKSRPTTKATAKTSSSQETATATGVTSKSSHEVVERESHIEFDERLVHGQTAAGAIYLFQRAPSEFKSVVQPPESFRARTVSLLAPDRSQP